MTDDEKYLLRRRFDVETYAELLAHVVHFGSERALEVTERLGLPIELWRQIDEAWIDELAAGLERQQKRQGLRFSSTFARVRAKLNREALPVAAIRKHPYVEHEMKKSSSGASVSKPVEGARISTPAAPPASAFSRGISGNTNLSPWVARSADATAAPAAAASIAPTPSWTPAQPSSAAPSGLQGTRLAVDSRGESAAMPFRGGASPLASTPPRPEGQGPSASTGTAFLPDEPAPALRISGLEAAVHGATTAEPLPLTIEHYAAMIAELNKKPGREEMVYGRYNIRSEADRSRVMRAMASYLVANPLERTKYEMLLQRFAGWMK